MPFNTLADDLRRLVDATDAIGQAIIDAGGTVNEYDRLEEYPADIKSINRNTTSIDITENGSYYAGEENTITTTSFPITIQNSVGNPMKHVTVDGNMQQNGTPTPQSPIQPNETGERTGNLWDGNYENGVLNPNGTLDAPNVNYNTTMYIPTEEKNYTLSVICNYDPGLRLLRVCFYDENKNFISYVDSSAFKGKDFFYEFNFTAPVNSKYLRFSYIFRANMSDTNIMLNLGSTALPYEPYGYKIPISSGGVNLLPEFYATSGEISGNSYTITKNSIETHNKGNVLGAYYVLTEFKRSGNYANYALIDEDHSFKIPAGTYTFSANENTPSLYNGLCLIVGQLGQTMGGATTGGAKNIHVGQTFTINEDSYVCPVLEIRSDSRVDEYIMTNPMLNLGVTALPYEPYIEPTETNIYLGDVESTRKIRKLVLDGTENWNYSVTSQAYWVANVPNDYDNTFASQITTVCTHYRCIRNDTGLVGMINGDLRLYAKITSPIAHELYIKDETYTSAANFKAYLQQQYAAGTPVTIWYVLANETTGIVNEPIRKIGNYVDTVSTDINLPLSSIEPNIIDIDTSLKPSSASFTYNKKNEYIGYNEINVNVPNTYTAEDEGKVVDNATLVAQTAMPTEITANDTYDTTLYNSITVNVPLESFITVLRATPSTNTPTDIVINNTPSDSLSWLSISSSVKSVEFANTPTTPLSSTLFSTATNLEYLYLPWAENQVAGAPWGAPQTTIIIYNYPSNILTRNINFVNDTTTLTGSPTNLRTYNMITRCTVADDGTITAFYGDSNYTEDGSIGQVMVRVPKFYYKMTPITLEVVDSSNPDLGNHIRVGEWSISDVPRPGYKLHPAFINENGDEVDCFYMSAFESSIYNSTTSTYYTEDDQVIGSGTAASNYLLSSIANVRPCSGSSQNLTRTNCEIMANNRGTGWHSCTYTQIAAVQMLIVVEHGANSQSAIANGVAFGSDPDTSKNCAVFTGSTTGNTTGRATESIPYNYYTTEPQPDKWTATNRTSCNWRGLENLWGNIWTHIMGVTVRGDGSQRGGIPYVCTDFNFSEPTSTTFPSNYVSPGFTITNTSGYIKAFGYGDPQYDWMFFGSDTGTTASINDYHYITANLNGNRTAFLGGRWMHSADAGLFYWRVNFAVDIRDRTIGARLCYMPQA